MPHSLFSRWRYSTRILFSGCDQATYQQDLVIHRMAGRDYEEDAGGFKIWHIFIGPKCRPDYGDLRFTDGDARGLTYYLWPDYDAESARFTVRLKGADQSGALVIWYGNPTATTTSDGDATFEVFDDFEEGDLSSWELLNLGSLNSVTISTEQAAGGDRSMKIVQAHTSGYSVCARRATPISEGVLEVDLYDDGDTSAFKAVRLISGGNILCGFGVWTGASTSKYVRHSSAFSYTVTSVSRSVGWHKFRAVRSGSTVTFYIDGTNIGGYTVSGTWEAFQYDGFYRGTTTYYVDNSRVRAYSATPPSILRTSRGVNPAYAGLARLTGSAAADDGVIRFAGVGSILVVGDEREAIAGAGSFAIETSVRSQIPIAGAAEVATSLRLVPTPAAITGAGGATSPLTYLTTPLDIEAGEGSAYVAPTPVQFDLTKYRFSSLTISRSAQDALWQCEGRIVGLDAPLAYKQFEVRVPDHNGVLRTLFVGFVPGRDYVRAVAADESIIQGYDAGFYLTRQYLPDGDLNYPKEFAWGPMSLLRYWLGEETTTAGSRSRWEQVTGIYPYRLSNPHSYYEWPYDKRIDWNFMPKTTKAQAIQEVCEKSGLVFLVKWKKINGVWRPCAYLVPEEDIDHYSWGLDLPGPVTFTHPDPHVMDGVRVTMRSDEKYNRIEVRSASPSGAWFHAVRETPALQAGEELPIEYLEERSDLPIDADHGGWCNARADELYAYYTKYAYTYTLTLINRVDLELYQRCRFYGFDTIPSGEMMRIVAITYNVLPTHTEVEITVTPDSRLSDLRKLQRSQAADSVSEVQTIAQSQIDRLAAGEVGTVVGIDGAEAIVELERKADSSVRGRIV